MSRVSNKQLHKWIGDWNRAYPELYMRVQAYNGYYHIGLVDENGAIIRNIVVEETPGRAWEVFCAWKDGFYTYERMIETGVYQTLQAKGKIIPMQNQ